MAPLITYRWQSTADLERAMAETVRRWETAPRFWWSAPASATTP